MGFKHNQIEQNSQAINVTRLITSWMADAKTNYFLMVILKKLI